MHACNGLINKIMLAGSLVSLWLTYQNTHSPVQTLHPQFQYQGHSQWVSIFSEIQIPCSLPCSLAVFCASPADNHHLKCWVPSEVLQLPLQSRWLSTQSGWRYTSWETVCRMSHRGFVEENLWQVHDWSIMHEKLIAIVDTTHKSTCL